MIEETDGVSPHPAATGRVSQLGRRAIRGALRYTGVALFGWGIAFIGNLVLVRLLAPADFGTFALATATIEFVMLAGAWSFSSAFIQSGHEREKLFGTAVTLSLLLGIALLGISAVVAYVLSWVYSPLTVELFLAVSSSRVLSPLSDTFSAYFERHLEYRPLATAQITAVLGSLAMAVPLAMWGWGAWSLAVREIATTAITLLVLFGILLVSQRSISMAPSWSTARWYLRFGSKMTLSRLGEVLFHRADRFILGSVAGTAGLGLYTQALYLVELPNKFLGPSVLYVPMASYSRLQDDPVRFGRLYDLLTYVMVRVLTPLALLFLLLGDLIVLILFGPQWVEASQPLQGLAGYVVLFSLFDHLRVALVASGNVSYVLKVRMAQLLVYLPTVVVLSWWLGPLGAGLALTIGMLAGLVLASLLGRPSIISGGVRQYYSVIVAVVIASVVQIAARSATGLAPSILALGLYSVVVCGTFGVVMLVLERRRLTQTTRDLWRRAF